MWGDSKKAEYSDMCIGRITQHKIDKNSSMRERPAFSVQAQPLSAGRNACSDLLT